MDYVDNQEECKQSLAKFIFFKDRPWQNNVKVDHTYFSFIAYNFSGNSMASRWSDGPLSSFQTLGLQILFEMNSFRMMIFYF